MMSSREKKPYPELSRTNNFQRMLDIERKGRVSRTETSSKQDISIIGIDSANNLPHVDEPCASFNQTSSSDSLNHISCSYCEFESRTNIVIAEHKSSDEYSFTVPQRPTTQA
jgi:hypothetical protein